MRELSIDRNATHPVILDPQLDSDWLQLQSSLTSEYLQISDTYEAQVAGLLKIRSVGSPHTQARLIPETQDEMKRQGRWVFYPWSGHLVHLLAAEEFRELRTNRNQHKILSSEQLELSGKTIGIVGLSVGHSAALTLVLEGIAGSYRLADFDELELSNLNRIRTGVHNLGVNKAVLTAREMLELDPYIDVRIYDKGLTSENMSDFFGSPHKLDLVVDECDDLFAKVRLREYARDQQIPVLMDTSDGGLLDVERFDLEPERALFHGALPNIGADDLVGLSTKDKIPFVLAILGVKEMSGELAGSLIEIDKSLSTWPQLGSAVTLGGALIAHSARSILLKTFSESGRFRVDLEKSICAGQQHPVAQATTHSISTHAQSLPRQAPNPGFTEVNEEFIQYLLQFAIRAPSGGNAQPWQFHWQAPLLYCSVDGERGSFLDFQGGASRLALGAAVQNIELAAANAGFRTEIEHNHVGSPHACTLLFYTEANITLPNQELFFEIFNRATNRNLGTGQSMSSSEISSLTLAATQAGGTLHPIIDRHAIDAIGELLGICDTVRFLSPHMHAELMSEIRWNAEQVESTRDGIDIETLELPASERSILRVLSRPDVPLFLNRVGGGSAIGDAAIKANTQASSMLLITVPRGEAQDFRAGQCMQAIWLAATQLNLGLWPQGVPFFLLARARSNNNGLTKDEVDKLLDLGSKLESICSIGPEDHVAMLFRCSHVSSPSAYALRRSLEDSYSASLE